MKKAMTMPMTLVITIVVLVVVAAIVISISSDRLYQSDDNLQDGFGKVGGKLTDLAASAGDGLDSESSSKSSSSSGGSSSYYNYDNMYDSMIPGE